MTKFLNLVYDDWDGETYHINGPKHFNKLFHSTEEFIFSYLNSFCSLEDAISVKRYKLDEITDYQNYYYFFNHSSIDMCKIIESEFFIEFSQNYLKKYSKLHFVFQTSHESDNEKGFESLVEHIKKYNLNYEQFIVINNNSKLKDFKTKYNSNIKIHNLSYLPICAVRGLEHIGGCEYVEDKDGKFFMTFNRGPKLHRLSLLVFLLKHDILNNTNWSYIPNYKRFCAYEDYLKFFDEDEIVNYVNEIDFLNNLETKISDFEKDTITFTNDYQIIMKRPDMNVGGNPEQSINYVHSYVNITTESSYFNTDNVIHITEKSFKPFYFYQIPLFFATTGHVKMLKEKYNFDVFEDLIDGSYDNELDDKKRFKLLCVEIKKLNDNKLQVIEFYKNNKDRFIDNKSKVLNVMRDNNDFQFFKNLI
jgi:hypothetical protein